MKKHYYEAPGSFVAEFEAGSAEAIKSTVNMIEARRGVKLRKITKERYEELIPVYSAKNKTVYSGSSGPCIGGSPGPLIKGDTGQSITAGPGPLITGKPVLCAGKR